MLGRLKRRLLIGLEPRFAHPSQSKPSNCLSIPQPIDCTAGRPWHLLTLQGSSERMQISAKPNNSLDKPGKEKLRRRGFKKAFHVLMLIHQWLIRYSSIQRVPSAPSSDIVTSPITSFSSSGTILAESPSKNQSPSCMPPAGTSLLSMLMTATRAPFIRARSM